MCVLMRSILLSALFDSETIPGILFLSLARALTFEQSSKKRFFSITLSNLLYTLDDMRSIEKKSPEKSLLFSCAFHIDEDIEA